MAITRLWFFTLKPNTSFSDPAFLKIWHDVLELCARYTPAPGPSSSQILTALLSQPCPKRAHHFLFHSTNTTTTPRLDHSAPAPAAASSAEPIFVLICSYPSFALCTQADAAYVQKFHPQMSTHVRHLAMRQLDMEDAEVVPALLASASASASSSQRHDGAHDPDAPTVTVAISNSDPLVAEAMSSSTASLAGTKIEIPPPNVEISGADVFALPPMPVVNGDGRDGAEEDLFAVQRGEGRKWIRISRGPLSRMDDIDIEVYQLKELMAQ